jgi:hypothetical protein
MAKLLFPKSRSVERFPRWRLVWWLLFYVEDSLSRLPMLLLGPTTGAVLGTAIAVSELSSVTIDGKVAAAVPSVWDVLLPALLGGLGGIVVLTIGSAIWGALRYLAFGGDDIWEAVMPATLRDRGTTELRCKPGAQASITQLEMTECVIKRPSGAFEATAEYVVQPEPYGLLVRISNPQEAGTYEVRWYATEHKRRVHEVARIKQTFAA